MQGTDPDKDAPPSPAEETDLSVARSPRKFGWRDWKQIIGRVMGSFASENLTLVAAGVGFYAVLALVPTIVVLVSVYGFFADPGDMVLHVEMLRPVVPETAFELIRDQVMSLAERDNTTFGWTSIGGFLLMLWLAKAGVDALATGLNIANREREGRSFLRAILVSYVMTFGLVVVMAITLVAIVLVPAVVAVMPGTGWHESLALWLRWPIAILAVMLAIGTLYRLGPSRRSAKLHWLSPGAVLATVVWAAGSAGFSYYVATFADYQGTYGALGAVVVLMMWFWISALIVLVGARLNAEMEFQTAADTTIGPDRPMGRRGAFVADNVAALDADEALERAEEPLTDPGTRANK